MLTLRLWKPAGSFLRACWGWLRIEYSKASGKNLWTKAQKAMPSFQLEEKFWMSTPCVISEGSQFKRNSDGKKKHKGQSYVWLYKAIIYRHTERQDIFTSYGSVLALHQSRSICLTFLALGPAAGRHFSAGATAELALLKRKQRYTWFLINQKCFLLCGQDYKKCWKTFQHLGSN